MLQLRNHRGVDANLIPAILTKKHLFETIFSGWNDYRIEIGWIAGSGSGLSHHLIPRICPS
jgi:hypothetical protein